MSKPHYRLHVTRGGSWWMQQITPVADAWRGYSAAKHAIHSASYSFWKSPGSNEFRDSLFLKSARGNQS